MQTDDGHGWLAKVVAPARAISVYGVVLAIQTIVGLVQTAGLLAAVGPAPWQVLAVAQTAGILATTVTTAGLSSFGASVVAMDTRGDQPTNYLSTLVARAVIASVFFLGLVAGVIWASPEAAIAAVVTGAGSLLMGLTGSWYFIGRGEPNRWLRVEVLPLAIGNLTGVVLALAMRSAVAFAVAYLAGVMAAAWMTTREVRSDLEPCSGPLEHLSVLKFLAKHRALLAASVAGGINGQGPALLFAAAGSPVLAGYLLLDRLVKYVLAGLSPFLQVTQRWVPSGNAETRRRRGLTAVGVAAVGAVFLGVAFLVVGRSAVRALSSGSVVAEQRAVDVFALLVAVLVITQVNALAVLVPLGGQRVLARSTSLGAAVLVTFGLWIGHSHGPIAVAWTTVAVEVGILLIQLGFVLRRGASSAPTAAMGLNGAEDL